MIVAGDVTPVSEVGAAVEAEGAAAGSAATAKASVSGAAIRDVELDAVAAGPMTLGMRLTPRRTEARVRHCRAMARALAATATARAAVASPLILQQVAPQTMPPGGTSKERTTVPRPVTASELDLAM